jgi:hypothetical protein
MSRRVTAVTCKSANLLIIVLRSFVLPELIRVLDVNGASIMEERQGTGRKIALAIIIVMSFLPHGRSFAQSAGKAESLGAWNKIVTVLQHPRCLNCHQRDAPLQGDSRRPHIPRVVRGPDNHGVSAMRCGDCHNDTGNDPTARTPGARGWQLAPVSMRWQGLSTGELCRMLKNPKLNGDRQPVALIEHVDAEPLVLWGFEPGAGREPVPISHREFVDLMKVWVAGGAACPP